MLDRIKKCFRPQTGKVTNVILAGDDDKDDDEEDFLVEEKPKDDLDLKTETSAPDNEVIGGSEKAGSDDFLNTYISKFAFFQKKTIFRIDFFRELKVVLRTTSNNTELKLLLKLYLPTLEFRIILTKTTFYFFFGCAPFHLARSLYFLPFIQCNSFLYSI